MSGRAAVVLAMASLAAGPGCGRPATDAGPAAGPRFDGRAVRVGVVGDPALLETVAARRGEWEQTRGGRVELVREPLEPGKAAVAVDVVLYSAQSMGDLADAGALAPLPTETPRPPADPDEEPASTPQPVAEAPPDPWALADVLPGLRDQVAQYGGERLGMPYGGSALVLVYRREPFESVELKAEAEAAGVKLGPPTTWEELDALARFLNGRDWAGDGRPAAGLAAAIGPDAEGTGTAILLARAAAAGQHPDFFSLLFDPDTMAPRLGSPPFVEALTAIVGWRELGPEGAAGFDAEAARAAFRSGQAALLIDRAEKASSWGEPGSAAKVGVAPLPGSARVYNPDRSRWDDANPPNRPSYLPGGGGWLAGVSSKAADREAALDFAAYLVEPETAARVRVDRGFPMLSARGALLGAGPPDPRAALGVDGRSWADATQKSLLAPRIVPGMRLPGAAGYLADLDRARAAAVGGEAPAAALGRASADWDARTDRLGRARQGWHYQRSLNGPVITAEPPRSADPGDG